MPPTDPAPGGPDRLSPLAPYLAAIERAFAPEPEAGPGGEPERAPPPEGIAPGETPAAGLPVEVLLIGFFVAVSFLNAALDLFP